MRLSRWTRRSRKYPAKHVPRRHPGASEEPKTGLGAALVWAHYVHDVFVEDITLAIDLSFCYWMMRYWISSRWTWI